MNRHIFFDLDNTLWDHRKNAFLTIKDLCETHEILNKYSISTSDFHDVYYDINEKLWEDLRDNKIDKTYLREHRFYDTFLHFGVDNFELSQTFEAHFLDNILQYNELVDGALEILEYLKSKGYHLHIISNGFHEVTERKCVLSDISPYFESITSADSVGLRKPHKEIFDFALNRVKASKKESVMIGDDWIADVVGARNYGMDVIFFNALQEKVEKTDLKVVNHLLEIKNYL